MTHATYALLLACALLALPSCAEESGERTAPPHDAAPAHADAHPADEHGDGTLLVLDADALRDLRLTIRKAEQRPAGDTITALGSLELDPNGIRAVATPLAALVIALRKSVGETVAEGEVVVELRAPELARASVALESARARVTSAQQRRQLAAAQRDRIAGLAEERMATVRERQAADAELAAREADVADAETSAREAERTLAALEVEPADAYGRFALKAPAAGVIVSRDGVPGEAVEAGHGFLRIAKVTELLAVVHPFERDAVRIDASANVRLHASARPGRQFDARFLRAGPEVDPATRTLPVRLAVENPEGELLPGMSVTAEIRLAAPTMQEVVTVPLASVQRVDRDWVVFVPRGPGRFERRAIARGRDLGGEIEILSGLASGEEVVVEGAFVLRSESTRGADAGEEHHH